MSSEEKLSTLFYDIKYQFPTGCTTFGPCQRCNKSARGGRVCESCLEADLAKAVGEKAAEVYLGCLDAISAIERDAYHDAVTTSQVK